MPKKPSPQKPKAKPISLVIGAYGAGNFGDDLLFLAAANIEAKAGFEPICCGYFPPKVKQKFKFLDIADAASHVKALPHGSKVVLGGGGLLWSEESAARFSALIALAKMRGLKTAVHGIGLQGPGATLSASLYLMHECADEFSVRDDASLAILRGVMGADHKAVMLGDLVAREESAFLFERARKRKSHKTPVKIGFNLSWARFSQDAGFRHHVCLSLTNAALQLKGRAELHYVPQVMHRMSMDEQCVIFGEWLRVASAGAIKTNAPPDVAEDFVLMVAKHDVILAGRLHTAICAKMSGMPFAILNQSNTDTADKYHCIADAHSRSKINFDRHNWEVTDDIVSTANSLIVELEAGKVTSSR